MIRSACLQECSDCPVYNRLDGARGISRSPVQRQRLGEKNEATETRMVM